VTIATVQFLQCGVDVAIHVSATSKVVQSATTTWRKACQISLNVGPNHTSFSYSLTNKTLNCFSLSFSHSRVRYKASRSSLHLMISFFL